MTQLILIRTPMLSQAKRVVNCADLSFNTEISVIEKLSYGSSQKSVLLGKTNAFCQTLIQLDIQLLFLRNASPAGILLPILLLFLFV